MSRRDLKSEPTEDGLTCEYCGDLSPWDSLVCASCGWRLGAVQLSFSLKRGGYATGLDATKGPAIQAAYDRILDGVGKPVEVGEK